MYFMICKEVDMAPQPIRCLWSADNKNIKKHTIKNNTKQTQNNTKQTKIKQKQKQNET